MKIRYYYFVFFLLFYIDSSAQNVSVDATAGTTTGSYATLKDAFDYINNGTHQGVINISIHLNTTETASARLDSSGAATGANYTAVFIRPADTATTAKVVSTSVTGIVLVDLQGADNITIDGRPLGTGVNKLLTFQHTATTDLLSITLRLINGASNNIFQHATFINAVRSTVDACNINIGTSVTTTGNSNNLFYHCDITDGFNGFLITGTNVSPIDSLTIKGCNISQFSVAGVATGSIFTAGVDGNIIHLTIDSNNIFQTTTGVSLAMGLYLSSDKSGAVFNVTRNRIYDLRSATNQSTYGIYYSSDIASPAVHPVLNCFNNFISIIQSGYSVMQITGFTFSGAEPAICNFIHNSIRLGGTHTGSTGVASVGINKGNTSALSTWRCRSNISVNNRTGGSSGTFHGTSWASGIGASQTGIYDIDYNIYWGTGTTGSGGPFNAIWGGVIYGQTNGAGYINAATPNEQHSVFNNVEFLSNTDLSLTGASLNNLLVMGAPFNLLVPADIFDNPRYSMCHKGAYEAPIPAIDAKVVEVYTLGKLPVPYANPHQIRANIMNNGRDTLFNQQVQLSVSGANIFTDFTTIDTIPPLQSRYALFTPYYYSIAGSGLVTVTVPNDSNNNNNSKSFNQIVTTSNYAYAEPTLPAAGGIGFNGSGGDFVAMFPYTGYNIINQVGINFDGSGQPYQIVIYDMQHDTPGTLLWNSPTYTSVSGINTIQVIPSVTITGNFFVGIRQISTTNIGFGYQAEDPVRTGTFYYKATNEPQWTDFATTNSPFRFMVEPRLQVADDIGASGVINPCNAVIQSTSAFNPQFKIFNYGLNYQSSFIVESSITGPVNYSSSDVVNTSLATNSEIIVTASNTFNPTTAGTYTAKVWTKLAADLEPNNDTLTYVFTVINLNPVTNAGNLLNLNGVNQFLSIDGSGSLNIAEDKLTIEAWVRPAAIGNPLYLFSKDSIAFPQYDLYINASGAIVFKLGILWFHTDSVTTAATLPLLSFSHVAATYDGTYMSIYINGELAAQKLTYGNIVGNIQPLYIGKSSANNTYFNGSIDEIRIWDTCRTAEQIRQNLHVRMNNFAHPNLKAYYRLDESTGLYIADVSGNCNSALLNNAPTITASQIPLGNPAQSMQTVSFSGTHHFIGSSISMNIYNQAGTNDFYVHKFSGAPLGTSPVSNPGGITNVHNNYWIIYRYGTGTMDSSDVDFSLTGISGGAATTDIKLFTRGVGDNFSWNLTQAEATTIDFASQKVTMTLLASDFIKQFAIGGNNNPLPVTMGILKASLATPDVKLIWNVFSQINNKGFIVERSLNGTAFEQVDFVAGEQNSNQHRYYTYTDEQVFTKNEAATIYYRIRDIDIDGKTSAYTNTVRVSHDNQVSGIAVFPNPFEQQLAIYIDAVNDSYIKTVLTDLQGKELCFYSAPLAKGNTMFTIPNTETLRSGVYFLKVEFNNELKTLKVVKIN